MIKVFILSMMVGACQPIVKVGTSGPTCAISKTFAYNTAMKQALEVCQGPVRIWSVHELRCSLNKVDHHTAGWILRILVKCRS